MTRLREVAAGVLVTTSRNDALNSVVLVGPAGDALLVDPGWDQDELDDLAQELHDRGLNPVAGLATHAHHDHLLWHPDFGKVPRWASEDTTRLAVFERGALVQSLGDGYRPNVLSLFARVRPLMRNSLTWSGMPLELLIHDAHCSGHTALWIPGLGILIAGDMLSDVELPLLEESSLEDYRVGLELLATYASQAALVIPGHGGVGTDGAERVAADHRYLEHLAAGTEATDARLANPGMAEAHAANLAVAARRET